MAGERKVFVMDFQQRAIRIARQELYDSRMTDYMVLKGLWKKF